LLWRKLKAGRLQTNNYMPEKDYNWKRFWCPRETEYRLGDNGFLTDPDDDYGKFSNLNLISTENLHTQQYLILLGEPGIGKSFEINNFYNQCVTQAKNENLFIDLKSVGDENRLLSKIFEDEKFTRWAKGTHCLHLFLDSLDECLLRLDTVTSLLEEKFSKYRKEKDRLFLRIVSRTAEWHNSFEKGLGQLYGEEKVKAYKLAPLRKKDVHNAAQSEGIENPDKFMELIISNYAQPFAIKPVTLNMLIKIYKAEGAFPAKQSELYERGCKILCEEPSERRRETGIASHYQSDRLLSAASRIAAAIIFGKKYAVWTDIDNGDIPGEDIRISELLGGSEKVNSENITITEDLIRDTLRTGLFSSQGPHRMGWAHQTYAEFLAARYLSISSMSENQIMGLLTDQSDAESKIIPQLYETAAWIANTDENVLSLILENDPEVLLRSDVASFEVEDRKRLVNKLLILFDQEKLLDRDSREYYHKLKHPSLAEQVRPYIEDKTKSFLVRRAAIDIAWDCDVKEVLPTLLAVALDKNDNISIRQKSGYAITRIGDSESKVKLKPLVFGEAGDDPDDELKGCALLACWPDCLTAKELFTVLTPQRNPNLFGSYSLFLGELPKKLDKNLKPDDLIYALNWIADNPRKWGYHSDTERIRECIIPDAWKHLLDTPTLVKPFARAVFEIMKNCEQIVPGNEQSFNKEIAKDTQKRRIIVKEIAPLFIKLKDIRLIVTLIPLVIEQDINWLIKQYDDSTPEEAELWAKLISLFPKATFPWNFERVLKLRRTYHFVGKVSGSFLKLIKPIYILNIKIRNLYWHIRLRRHPKRRNIRILFKPSPKKRVLSLLNKFEKGDVNAWWKLNFDMTLRDNSSYDGNEVESDFTNLPVWEKTNEVMRKRIVRAAKEYLLKPPSMDLSWLGTDTFNRPHCAGYRAMILLMRFDPDFVAKLPASSWKIWAPIVMSYPLNTNQGQEPHSSIMLYCYKSAPDETIDALVKIVRKENNQHGHVFIIWRIKHIFDQRLGDALLNELCSPIMKPDSISDLLDFLIKRDFMPAIEYAVSEVSMPPPLEQIARGRMLAIAESLFGNRPGVAWPVLWPAIQTNVIFGKEIIERSVNNYRHDKLGLFTEQLSEQQIADMYLWMAEQYPYQKAGINTVSSFDGRADFRDGLLRHLEIRGTRQSLEQLRRIEKALPHLGWMKWHILESKKNTRAMTWNPLSPQQIISLSQDNQRTFVESGAQLLDVICESLQRLEKKIHELSAIEDLWDTHVYYPKDETYLSNYIARYLGEDLSKGRGIIVNREVQIQRGKETDIHIDAINPRAKGGVDIIKAIIEVKGCWHSELETAMGNQLVGKYLQDNQCPYGLYLVGWFACDKWADEYRKNKSPKYTIEQAQSHFEEQAKEVAGRSKISGLILRSYVLDVRL
jgi:predicted NACHT family NTPase